MIKARIATNNEAAILDEYAELMLLEDNEDDDVMNYLDHKFDEDE